MQNLNRAIRLTFRYKYSIIASVFCAMMIGVLWGGNIGVIAYTIVDISFNKTNFVDWSDQKIEENDQSRQKIRETLRDLEQKRKQSADPAEIKQFKRAIKAERNSLWYYDLFDKLFQTIKPTIDRYAPRDPFHTVWVIISFALLASLVKGGFTILHAILSARIALRTICEIRNMMFRKIIRYEVNYFSQEGISNAMNRLLSDSTNLSTGLTVLYGKLIREPIKLIACLLGAALISWQLLLLTLLLVPLAAYAIRWLAKSLKRVVRRGMEQGVKLFGRLEESIRSIRVVKSFVRERGEYGKFRQTNQRLYELNLKTAKYDALTNPLTEVLGILMICVAVLAGSYLVMNEQTSIFGIPMSRIPLSQTMLIVFFGLLAGAADPARKLSDIFTQFQTAIVAADRVYEMIDRPILIKDKPDAVRIARHRESIEFDRVSYRYHPDRAVLHDISLKIHFGETLGILGPSGCGKSTLLSLIPRFMDPSEGEVRIDGLPIQNVKMNDLRRMMGIITQEPVLFDDTIANNIRYGRPLATQDEVIEAAKNAFAHEFITGELSGGYDMIVGPGGGKLSGGQRQRIALARAFLCDPAIFLLDEATSQIDLYSEQMIHKALEKFVGSRTTIIVTHRLSALSLADRIVVMRDGILESVGTHEELLQKSPFYNRLHQIEQNEKD